MQIVRSLRMSSLYFAESTEGDRGTWYILTGKIKYFQMCRTRAQQMLTKTDSNKGSLLLQTNLGKDAVLH